MLGTNSLPCIDIRDDSEKFHTERREKSRLPRVILLPSSLSPGSKQVLVLTVTLRRP